MALIMQATGSQLRPLYDLGRDSVQLDFAVQPSSSLKAGTLVGVSTTAQNDVQTVAVTGTPTGGSVTWNWVHPLNGAPITFVLAYNSTATQGQTALNNALALVGSATGTDGANLITVGGGALPGSALTFTGNSDAADKPLAVMTQQANNLTGGTTPASTVTHTTTGASGKGIAAYDNSTIATAIGAVVYDTYSDAAGNVTLGQQSAGGEKQQFLQTAPVFVKGYFNCADLIGLDSGAVTDLGHLVSGTTTAGILRMS